MGTLVSMDKNATTINAGGRWAPLTNLALAARALERAMNRSSNLPGLVVLYGYSGLGKSHALSYCANLHECFYVECQEYFNRKLLALAILREMGVKPGRTIGEMMEQASQQLELSQRALILDNADYLVDKKLIDTVLALHEMARATIMLAGEEQFPRKLLAWERAHRRVLVWQLAQPASAGDAQKLVEFYVPGVDVAKDLLDRVCEKSRNVPGRICVNLDTIRDHCQKNGLKKIDLDAWGKRELYSGDAPVRRPV